MDLVMAALRTRVSAIETGESPFAVRIATHDHSFIGDEPASAGGGGLGPNPLELLASSLAECTVMTVRWFALQQGWPVEHIEVVVDHVKTVIAGAAAPIDIFDKTVSISAPLLGADQLARLMEIAGKCPVQRVLEGAPLIRTKAGASTPEH
ncbi:OsmC family protein [Sphingomonas psychrotolerans]|uniref:Osmotically inducible protein OsmC n=1 Tax=Sphingomonas psychrotolerans TaxID=1327635 RepID=A0A2K8MS77_9SPHN|nr:OsmC family protein [Sphingomonas psychrotolerans]ATY34879.1 osmotically inducible protein OsmC [Sphingomonas psychrotolerans]